jgi:hypothetical protein
MALQFNNEEMSVEQKLALLEAKYAVLKDEKAALEHANAKLIEQNEAKKNEAELNKKLSEMESRSLKDDILRILKSSDSIQAVMHTRLYAALIERDAAQLELSQTQEEMAHCKKDSLDDYLVVAESLIDLRAEHDTLKADYDTLKVKNDELEATLNFVLSSRN